jgi:exonuclease III
MKINVNGVQRDATGEELATIEQTQADMIAEQEKHADEAQTRNAAAASGRAKLAALGLTDDEITALLGA